MPDFPREDLTHITVRKSCPACTLDSPCHTCTLELADAETSVAERLPHMRCPFTAPDYAGGWRCGQTRGHSHGHTPPREPIDWDNLPGGHDSGPHH